MQLGTDRAPHAVAGRRLGFHDSSGLNDVPGGKSLRRHAQQARPEVSQLAALVEDQIKLPQRFLEAPSDTALRISPDVAAGRPAARRDAERPPQPPGERAGGRQVEGQDGVEAHHPVERYRYRTGDGEGDLAVPEASKNAWNHRIRRSMHANTASDMHPGD